MLNMFQTISQIDSKDQDLQLSDNSNISNDDNSSNSSFHEKNEINRKKILRDLNSPSASVRLRAIRALKSPMKSCYNYDVPHQMQDIITDEDRNSPKPRPFEEIMKNVVLYVDIRSDGHNISQGIRNKIMSFGIKVNSRFLKNTTHVVFKDGSQSTYDKAKTLNIPIVSLLWIEECKKRRALINTEVFKISNIMQYEHPELYSKPKRRRCNTASPKTTPKKRKNKENQFLSPSISKSTDKTKGSYHNTSEKEDSSDDDDSFVESTPKPKRPNTATNLIKAVLLKNNFNQMQEHKKTIADKDKENTPNLEKTTKSISQRRRTTITTTNMEETLLNPSQNVGRRSAVTRSQSKSMVHKKKLTEQSFNIPSLASDNMSDSTFVKDNLAKSKRQRSYSFQIQNMDETLINSSNVEQSKITATAKRRRNNTTYNNKSLEISLIVDDKNKSTEETINSIAINKSQKMNDENIKEISYLTPISAKKCATPKNIASLFDTATKSNVKKRKLFVHDILLTPSPPPSSLSSSSNTQQTSQTAKRTHQRISSEEEDDEIEVVKRMCKRETEKINLPKSFSITKTKSEPKIPYLSKNNKDSRHSSMYFDLNRSLRPSQKKFDLEIQSRKGMVCTSVIKKEHVDLIHQAIKKLGEFTLEQTVTNRTTHIICFQTRRTMNLLRGMIRGVWILNYNWIIDSIKSNKWLYEEEYEIQNFSRTIQICRSQRQAFGKNYRLELFESLSPIYVSSKCQISCKNIKELIVLCYGKLAKSKNDAKYIIGEFYANDSNCNKSNDDNGKNHKICLRPEWILDSIMNNRIQKFRKYLIKENM